MKDGSQDHAMKKTYSLFQPQKQTKAPQELKQNLLDALDEIDAIFAPLSPESNAAYANTFDKGDGVNTIHRLATKPNDRLRRDSRRISLSKQDCIQQTVDRLREKLKAVDPGDDLAFVELLSDSYQKISVDYPFEPIEFAKVLHLMKDALSHEKDVPPENPLEAESDSCSLNGNI